MRGLSTKPRKAASHCALTAPSTTWGDGDGETKVTRAIRDESDRSTSVRR